MDTNPHKIFQQSVTMTAKMWPQTTRARKPSPANLAELERGVKEEWEGIPIESIQYAQNSSKVCLEGSRQSFKQEGNNHTVTEGNWELGWRVPPHHWPLLVAMFCGGALVLLLVVTTILWHCCVAPHRNKDYRVKMDGETLPQRGVVPVLPSHSAVFVEPKYPEWNYSSRLVAPQHWLYNKQLMSAHCNVPRSLSVPAPATPVPPRRQSSPSRVIFPDSGPCSLPLPYISEFSPGAQYASSSILDEFSSRDLYPSVGGVMLKTQSLPACVRSKHRPASTADDIAELYAKVNFSKKRKNRMRNDEAAIIALSKSRSQFLHKDTDSLVDNEAVIVYDERTAL